MDLKLFRLLRCFSEELISTAPRDVEVLAALYVKGAYELGRHVGPSEAPEHNGFAAPY